jgi:hypothetical protein
MDVHCLITEDGVHTTTALRLHGTPTAVQTQFKRNSKCGCGGMCVVHQAVNWHPWCVGHWILVPHGVPGHRRWRANYDRTTTARHPNRYSNAIQTVELQIQCRGNAILCVCLVSVWSTKVGIQCPATPSALWRLREYTAVYATVPEPRFERSKTFLIGASVPEHPQTFMRCD